MNGGWRAAGGAWGWVVAWAVALPADTSAQDTVPVAPGVELGLLYDASPPPRLVVRPFRGSEPASAVGAILSRDLELSDRFHVLEPPGALAAGSPDFAAWDGLNVDYLVDGAVRTGEEGSYLRVTVHDVLYTRILDRGEFALPGPGAPAFRMAVHRVSDEVVRWITGEPGMAASRVAYMRRLPSGGTELMTVDADGEDRRRLAGTERLAFSPAWFPDGTRIAYTSLSAEGTYRVLELELASGRDRDRTPGPGLNLTPAYASDGSRMALAISTGPREDLWEMELGGGTLRRIETRAMAPAYSADGRLFAYQSDRLGRSQIWVVERPNGDPALVSPYGSEGRAEFQLPDWSPVAPVVAFHGGIGSAYQVLVVDLADPRRRVSQLTREGWSESPSWAPDGRHLVVHGQRRGRTGLWVLDSRSQRIRLLVEGADVRTPDWSPSLEAPAGAGA